MSLAISHKFHEILTHFTNYHDLSFTDVMVTCRVIYKHRGRTSIFATGVNLKKDILQELNSDQSDILPN